MRYTWNTKDWGWRFEYCTLELENTKTKEGFTLETINDVISYLAYYPFNDDYVYEGYIMEAVYNCATELGCVYSDVEELENDIRKYYI